MLKGMDLFQKEMESGDYCIREVVRVKVWHYPLSDYLKRSQ